LLTKSCQSSSPPPIRNISATADAMPEMNSASSAHKTVAMMPHVEETAGGREFAPARARRGLRARKHGPKEAHRPSRASWSRGGQGESIWYGMGSVSRLTIFPGSSAQRT
jgi:hypothetical protein